MDVRSGSDAGGLRDAWCGVPTLWLPTEPRRPCRRGTLARARRSAGPPLTLEFGRRARGMGMPVEDLPHPDDDTGGGAVPAAKACAASSAGATRELMVATVVAEAREEKLPRRRSVRSPPMDPATLLPPRRRRPLRSRRERVWRNMVCAAP